MHARLTLRSATQAGCLVLTTLAGCATPQAVRSIVATHPEATYVTSVHGCDRLTRKSRQFGEDLWRAVRWSREVVAISRMLPCESVVEAVVGDRSTAVYRVARTLDGRRLEGRIVLTED
jgi:hypothetical protein